MWSTGATQMIARLTGSTLFANHNLASMVAFDLRSASTTTTTTTTSENSNLLTKMRVLRARSPYALFMKDNYNEISAKNPNSKLPDISKKVAEVWKSLSDEKKQNYVKQFEDQRANYEAEKQRLSPTDLQTVDADQRAKRIQNRLKKSMENLPTKRPRSAFIHFLSSLNRGEADIGEFMRGASQRWSNMAAEEKEKFEALHQEEKQKYVRDLVAWAASVDQESKPASRRSTSADSTKTKDTPVKKTRATGKRTAKKRTTASSKPAVATKSTQTKSTKAAKTSDQETSTDDDEKSSSSTTKKSTDSKKS